MALMLAGCADYVHPPINEGRYVHHAVDHTRCLANSTTIWLTDSQDNDKIVGSQTTVTGPGYCGTLSAALPGGAATVTATTGLVNATNK